MQGPVENALMIVCAGNAFLRGDDVGGFWPDAQTFKFLELCEFRLPPPSGEDADEYPLLAPDPMAWFASLRPWSRGLRLHCVPRPRAANQTTDTPDRMLVAFVGGGPRWLIEAVGDGRSEVWEGFHRIGDQKAADGRIWRCTHVKQGEINPDDVDPPNLMIVIRLLREVLVEIEAYARAEKLDGFADCFARASHALKAEDVEDYPWSADVLRWTGFHKMQLRWLQAIKHAWVFGGMRSWNDIGGKGEVYEELSERLYNTLNATTAALANSTYPV
jgi:hypothetical protein